MRAYLVVMVLALAGCSDMTSSEPIEPIGPEPIGPTGPVTLGCTMDTQCTGPGQVCARDGDCVLSDDVHAIKVVWTLSGGPANATTCATVPPLALGFAAADSGVTFGFAPVPCSAGVFPIDKLELEYTEAALSYDNGDGTLWSAPIDPTTGLATIDLPL